MRLPSSLGIATLLFVATHAHSLESPANPTPDRGAATLYAQLCAGCHGAKLEGGNGPSLLLDDPPADAELARIIREGNLESGMPPFAAALSEAETRALVVLILETSKRRDNPIAWNSNELPAGIQRSEYHGYRIEKVIDGLDVPWSLAFLPDGRLVFTQRTGKLSVATPGDEGWTTRSISGVPPVWVRDEGGLLAVATHPDYADNGWLYLTLSDPGENDTGNTKLVRGRVRDGRWTDQETLFEAPRDSYTNLGVNFGSRLVFHDGHAFFSFGERGQVGQAQDLSLPNGKVHRILPDGSVPKDNPFANTPGALPSIWSYGHRNPQGLAVHPVTGDLWETEHGPRGGDELNHVRRGLNYGWPVITHGMKYDGTPVSSLTEKEGLEQPAIHWTPSIAVSPIRFYTGDAFPKWKHHLFLGALAQQELRRLEVDGGRVTHQELILKNRGRVRDMITGPDGFLYVALEIPGPDTPDIIIRLVPAE